MNRSEAFEEARPLLFSIAYRMLGSVSEAEDAVQESWLRFAASTVEPDSTRGFLSTVVTRIAIDQLRSARVRREQYPGPWLPEPLLEDPYADTARAVELSESISVASLLLLERLTPLERAVFVLRDVFAFEFAEIADAVGRSEAACRQLVVRARRHMEAGRPRFEADAGQREALARSFFDAIQEGNVDDLRNLLATDVRLVGDGGGKSPQFKPLFEGVDQVARLLASIIPAFLENGGRIQRQAINGQPGAVFTDRDGKIMNTYALHLADGQVRSLFVVSNPDKLSHLGSPADAWAFLAEMKRRARAGRAGQDPNG